MTEPITTGRQRLEKRNRYRRLMYLSIGGGIAGLFLATVIWIYVPADPVVFAGVGIYWLGVIGYLAVQKGTSQTLFDEREQEIEPKTSGLTLGVFAYVVVGVPAVVALSITETYAVPSMIWDVLVGSIGLFVVFGIVYTYVTLNHS